MNGRNWLVRRAEKRLSPQLGGLVYVASSRRVRWSWLLPCLVAGFVYGIIGQFITTSRSTDLTPDRFENIPLFVVVSFLTGLILWGITFTFAFRKLLVFEGGIVASFASKSATKVFPWHRVNVASIRAVTTQDGASPTRLLAAETLTKLGLRGTSAVVFHASNEPTSSSPSGTPTVTGLWSFESTDDPALLVNAIQYAAVNASVPGASQVSVRGLPPVVLTTKTELG